MKYRVPFSLRWLPLAAFALLVAFSGCKKDEAPEPPAPTNSEKILGTWTLTSEQQDQNGTGQFKEITQACDLDDTWTFTADGILTGSQSGTTCDPGSPAGFTCSWKLQDEETVLYRSFGPTFDKYKIVTLDDKTLLIHRPLSLNDVNGKVYSKVTFKR
jgi:hypothetical protein